MADNFDKFLITALNMGFACDQQEMDACRAEIKQRGTYWAGGEIWRLRKQVATLRKNLTDCKNREISR